MSSTPEINRSVKFSPYGKPISKSLLTPCRTLGLSRKRKTPSNLMKTPLNSSITTSNECISSPLTPLNHNTSVTPLHNNTPVTVTCLNSTLVYLTESKGKSANQLTKRPKRDVKNNSDKTAKRCLDQNFKNTLQEESELELKVDTSRKDIALKENTETPVNILAEDTNNMHVISQNSKKSKLKKNIKNKKNSLEKLSDANVENYKDQSDKIMEENISSDESEEIIKVRKRRQAVILSDEDENNDFEGFIGKKNKENGELKDLNKDNEETFSKFMSYKETESEKCNKEEDAINKNTKSDLKEGSDYTTRIENVLVGLNMENQNANMRILSQNEILTHTDRLTEKTPVDNTESDFEKLSGNSTKSGNNKNHEETITSNKKAPITNDNDDFVTSKNNKKKLKLTRKESDRKNEIEEEKRKSKALKTTDSSEKYSKTVQQTKSLTIIIDDEEDAFTSTPEREKNEKYDLIGKIKNLEEDLKKKRKKIDDLRQAEIYKTKHNIDELKNVTEIWREGCVRGLNELLIKLQTHGPMDMLTLVNNLKIPSDILKKCLKLDLMEDKKNQDKLKNDSEDFDDVKYH